MTDHTFLHSMRRMGAFFVCLQAAVLLYGQDPSGEADIELSPQTVSVVTSLHELDLQGKERIEVGVPVEVSAYVTYHDPVFKVLFVQDDSAGIYVAPNNQSLPYLPVGTRVKINAVAQAGLFKPYLSNADVIPLEEPPKALDPLGVLIPILESGRHDGQMVGVQGRVISADLNHKNLELLLLVDGRSLSVYVRDCPIELDGQALVDSVVDVSGACGFSFEGSRMISVRLYLDRFHQLKVVEPAQTSFSQAPVERINVEDLKDKPEQYQSRALLYGHFLGMAQENRFFFQTTAQGFLVELTEPDLSIKHGDPIGVLGWARLDEGGSSIRIEAARIERVTDDDLVPSLADQSTDALTTANLNRWLSIQGTLLNTESSESSITLYIQSEEKHITAMLIFPSGEEQSLIVPEVGSTIGIQGVLTGLPSKPGLGEFISIKVFSASDIRVLSPPSWWTVSRIAWALVGAGCIGLFALVWSVSLNRKVKQQTSTLRQTLEHERLIEERYRKIFESALDMILVTDQRSKILSINPAGAKLLQVEPTDIQGKSFLDWVYLEDKTKAEEAFGLGTKTSHELSRDGDVIELRLVTQGGERLYVELSVRGVLLSEETYGYQCIARNIDARKQSEAHLIKARNAYREANRAKSSFLAMMSHELRTPMNGVMGMTQMLQQTKLDAHQKELAKTIQMSSQSMMKLILDLLDISRIESNQLKLADESFDLVQLVEEALATFYPESKRKKLDMTLYFQPRIPRQVRGDANRVRQIILNLVGNAIKFTEKGGVAIRITGEPQSKTVHQIRFEVMDTGVGLGGLRQKDLFEAFVQLDSSNTRKFGGAGLGLSICKRIVQAMGGVIGVEGQTKRGAVFWFEIPFKMGHAQSSVRPPTMNAKTAEHEVLIVSRSALVQDYFRLRCQDMDLSTQSWNDVRFLETAKTKPDAFTKKPAVVIWDLEYASKKSLKSFNEAADMVVGDSCKWVLLSSYEEAFDFPRDTIRKTQLLKLLKPLTESTFQTFCDFISDHEAVNDGIGSDGNAAGREATASQENEQACRGLKVLVAEDDMINQKLILLYLKKAGCEYEIVPDGMQVLSMIEKQSFDVILMDCSMPVMDGFEATRRIRSNPKYDDLKVIALTAHSLKGDRERCMKAGMDDYMAKPLNLDLLTKKLSTIKTMQPANGH